MYTNKIEPLVWIKRIQFKLTVLTKLALLALQKERSKEGEMRPAVMHCDNTRGVWRYGYWRSYYTYPLALRVHLLLAFQVSLGTNFSARKTRENVLCARPWICISWNVSNLNKCAHTHTSQQDQKLLPEPSTSHLIFPIPSSNLSLHAPPLPLHLTVHNLHHATTGEDGTTTAVTVGLAWLMVTAGWHGGSCYLHLSRERGVVNIVSARKADVIVTD